MPRLRKNFTSMTMEESIALLERRQEMNRERNARYYQRHREEIIKRQADRRKELKENQLESL